MIKEEKHPQSLTNPLTKSQIREKELQRSELLKDAILKQNMKRLQEAGITTDDQASSTDSINAIVQTDLENIETDAEDRSNRTYHHTKRAENRKTSYQQNDNVKSEVPIEVEEPFSKKNLIVVPMAQNLENYLEEDLALQKLRETSVDHQAIPVAAMQSLRLVDEQGILHSIVKRSSNKDLEKRKLHQNLENFSVRLGATEPEIFNDAIENGSAARDPTSSIKSELVNLICVILKL